MRTLEFDVKGIFEKHGTGRYILVLKKYHGYNPYTLELTKTADPLDWRVTRLMVGEFTSEFRNGDFVFRTVTQREVNIPYSYVHHARPLSNL